MWIYYMWFKDTLVVVLTNVLKRNKMIQDLTVDLAFHLNLALRQNLNLNPSIQRVRTLYIKQK